MMSPGTPPQSGIPQRKTMMICIVYARLRAPFLYTSAHIHICSTNTDEWPSLFTHISCPLSLWTYESAHANGMVRLNKGQGKSGNIRELLLIYNFPIETCTRGGARTKASRRYKPGIPFIAPVLFTQQTKRIPCFPCFVSNWGRSESSLNDGYDSRRTSRSRRWHNNR